MTSAGLLTCEVFSSHKQFHCAERVPPSMMNRQSKPDPSRCINTACDSLVLTATASHYGPLTAGLQQLRTMGTGPQDIALTIANFCRKSFARPAASPRNFLRWMCFKHPRSSIITGTPFLENRLCEPYLGWCTAAD